MFLSTCIVLHIVVYLLGSSHLPMQIYAQEIEDFPVAYDIFSNEIENTIGAHHKDDFEFDAHHKDAFGYHQRTYDTAVLYIENNLDQKVSIWGQSDECYKCTWLPHLVKIKRKTTEPLFLDTKWPIRIAVQDERNLTNTICQEHFRLGERGNYTLIVNPNQLAMNRSDLDVAMVTCELVVNVEPRDSDIPMYIYLAVYCILTIIYTAVKMGYKQYREGGCTNVMWFYTTHDHLLSRDLGSPRSISVTTSDKSTVNNNSINNSSINISDKPKSERINSLDTFRGICVALMVFGNYGGGGYWYCQHGKWNGITPADIVFPWFIFIMGVSLTFSLKSLSNRKTSRPMMLYIIIKRSISLFAIGCVVDGGNILPYFRVPGVLQRFGVCYFVVAFLHLFSVHKLSVDQSSRIMNKYYAPFRDILDYWYEWLVITALMSIYFCITYLMPVPGCPTGYVGPGGPLVGKNGELTNCTGGAASYIDRLVVGSHHISQHCTPQMIYHTIQQHDPEGILGCFTSILLTYFGLQAGKIISMHQGHRQRLQRFMIWAVLTNGVGTLLCKASKEDGWIPLNKNLWSVSFILVAAGTGFALLAICYFTIDVKNWCSGVPFIFPGRNATCIYVGHEIVKKSFFPFSWQPLYCTHAELLLRAAVGQALWVIIAYWMFIKNIFISV